MDRRLRRLGRHCGDPAVGRTHVGNEKDGRIDTGPPEDLIEAVLIVGGELEPARPLVDTKNHGMREMLEDLPGGGPGHEAAGRSIKRNTGDGGLGKAPEDEGEALVEAGVSQVDHLLFPVNHNLLDPGGQGGNDGGNRKPLKAPASVLRGLGNRNRGSWARIHARILSQSWGSCPVPK